MVGRVGYVYPGEKKVSIAAFNHLEGIEAKMGLNSLEKAYPTAWLGWAALSKEELSWTAYKIYNINTLYII